MTAAQDAPRPRPTDCDIRIGSFAAGPLDAITDVPGVRVGHATLWRGDAIRSGVTVVLPHGEDPFRVKVPAAVVTRNGFGKLVGSTQIDELGELESPIALTSTLSVGRVADALVAWSLAQPGNEDVLSVNVVVGETNDGWLNDIRARPVGTDQLLDALAAASDGPVAGGAVGAGTGTRCLGFKGGIGTASRRVGDHTIGVLVQTNFGGELTIDGVPVGRLLRERRSPGRDRRDAPPAEHGSCVIVIATDAPLCARNLRRLAERSFAGMARTGASFSNGSGDYAIAFCNAGSQRVRADGAATTGGPVLRNDRMSPLFAAVADATEAAILDSLFRATTVTGRDGHVCEALPIDEVTELLRAARGR
ncbi:MAG: P1 family peptidase [Planctomycetes bacterium]|nr:P1 family peptidase [Planctomycetota bacterium]